ncbi:murein transglycosylase A [Aureimonas populi]|uniref:peptidoglycan lytic exotransglycosylase n=1 Tax=Aureimonas populi TaxID=1701758 RepID=A0ABW5CSW2_9HYPH|nr:MltA domain-containing protein [Aureimonas populi]
MQTDAAFQPLSFADLPGWRECDPAPALAAFRLSAPAFLNGAARTGTLGVSASAFRPAAEAAMAAPDPSPRAFFEAHFAPALIRPRGESGFLTGYYEPVLPASTRRTARFAVPLHRRPPDLVPVRGGVSGLDPVLSFARRGADGRLAEHPDRAAIARGALDGRGLELVWLESEVDAFFVHIQGSARLEMEGGEALRVGYAGKSGHPFTAIGRLLVQAGELTLEQADMSGIRRWLARNPARVRDLLDRNRSYIFFEARPVANEGEGPVGASGVPVSPLASLAVDGRLHTYGTPVFLHAPTLALERRPLARLTIAQDTGSAILGPARGDLFVGSGLEAGRVAGAIRHPAQFTALLPRSLLR